MFASNAIRNILIGVAALALASSTFFLGDWAIDPLLEEDGVVEYVGAAALLVASIVFFCAFLISGRAGYGNVKRIALLLLAALFFFGAGEEISWGQRIFGFETPPSIEESNTQGETTFHNLEFGGRVDHERLFQVFWVIFAVLIPIACALSARVRGFLGRLLPIFPVWLAILFAASFAIIELVEDFLGANPNLFHATGVSLTHARVEMGETYVCVLLALGAWVVFRETRAAGEQTATASGPQASPSEPPGAEASAIRP